MVNLYRRGRIGEKKIVNYLKTLGFKNIRRSKGSRGPADIYAKKNRRKYYFQVKVNTSKPTRKEIRKLREMARKRGGVAVVIQKTGNKKRWKFFGNWSR